MTPHCVSFASSSLPGQEHSKVLMIVTQMPCWVHEAVFVSCHTSDCHSGTSGHCVLLG